MSEGSVSQTAKQPVDMTFIREGRVYVGICPVHQPTSEPGSQALSITLNVVRGTVKCSWCGVGGSITPNPELEAEPEETWPALLYAKANGEVSVTFEEKDERC